MKSLKQLILESIEMENAVSFKECSLDNAFQTISNYPKNKRIWFTEDKWEEEDKKWFVKSAKDDNAVFYEIHIKNHQIGFIGLSSLLNMDSKTNELTNHIIKALSKKISNWNVQAKIAALCQPYIYMLCINNEEYKNIDNNLNVLDCLFSIYSKVKKELIYTYTSDYTLEKYKKYLSTNCYNNSSKTIANINKLTSKDIIKFITAVPKDERLYKIYTSNKIGFNLINDITSEGQIIHVLWYHLLGVTENNYYDFLEKNEISF